VEDRAKKVSKEWRTMLNKEATSNGGTTVRTWGKKKIFL